MGLGVLSVWKALESWTRKLIGVSTAACAIGQLVTVEFVTMDTTCKLPICLLHISGSLICGIGDLVPVEIWTLYVPNHSHFFHPFQISFLIPPSLQQNLGVTVASLPTLHPLVVNLRKSRVWQWGKRLATRTYAEPAMRYTEKAWKTLTVRKGSGAAVGIDQITLVNPQGISVERSIDVELAPRTNNKGGTGVDSWAFGRVWPQRKKKWEREQDERQEGRPKLKPS